MPSTYQPTTEPVATVQWTDNDTTHIGRVVQANGRDVVRANYDCTWRLVQHWPYDVNAKFEWVPWTHLGPYTGAKGTEHA